MEQQFALHCGIDGNGGLSLFEQNTMTAEERAWWIKKCQSIQDQREQKMRSSMHK